MLDESELIAQHVLYTRLAARAREQLERGVPDEDCPAIAAPPRKTPAVQ